jgi:hypothetical protein
VTGERPSANERSPRPAGQPGQAGGERPEKHRDGEHDSEVAHTTSTANTHDDTLNDPPDRATRLPLPASPYLTFTTSPGLPATDL